VKTIWQPAMMPGGSEGATPPEGLEASLPDHGASLVDGLTWFITLTRGNTMKGMNPWTRDICTAGHVENQLQRFRHNPAVFNVTLTNALVPRTRSQPYARTTMLTTIRREDDPGTPPPLRPGLELRNGW